MGVRQGWKLYQDPLYGAKVLSPLAVRVIDTPEFQRLAGLRQLGFSDVVYRGAHHTRFEHSVGTYFICRTIMRRLVQNHERLGLKHPGEYLSPLFREFPQNANVVGGVTTLQSLWRGLTEVISIAALLHDIGHVPFGHTLEDEFAGVFPRHDRLAGPRLYTMLFDTKSDLAAVFDEAREPWIGEIQNDVLRTLIYVILNWKEKIDSREGLQSLLQKEIEHSEREPSSEQGSKATGHPTQLERLQQLQKWHAGHLGDKLFHPFMSDIIGNTICSDLLDYLPRDRTYLGMEARYHSRIQRYFTIKPGTLYPPEEGLRMSIMVTRGEHGGQRRDVATAVLDIMRERYEMAERVYYHHKKAAASAMLAKLVELTPAELRPRDDEALYPAPWDSSGAPPREPPHMTHFSDVGLIEYLGRVSVAEGDSPLQKRLYSALTSRRRNMHRTLLVVDCDLANAGSRPARFIADDLRGPESQPNSAGRRRLETKLAQAGGAEDGDVIVYCPSPSMQSKEVDARMEIAVGRVLPLRVQDDIFTYHAEVELLNRYYASLWRAYVFVTPEIFAISDRCKAIVDAFCDHYELPRAAGYQKVRMHRFRESDAGVVSVASPDTATKAVALNDVLNEAVSALGNRALTITKDQFKSAIMEALGRAVGAPATRKPPMSTMELEEEIVRALPAGSRSRVGRTAVKNWVEKNPNGVGPERLDPFLDRIRVAVRYTPKDLWAARGRQGLSGDDGLMRFLDSCLALTLAEQVPSERVDDHTE
ncbi:MAG: HD domain-containing protein [Candidatus Solibacter usitatus]|nr:HD domain-containing protein [Candidatus Solibacter usitatus]